MNANLDFQGVIFLNLSCPYGQKTQLTGKGFIASWSPDGIQQISDRICLHQTSAISSWREVSRTGYYISKPAMDDNDALRTLVAEITLGLKTDDEKVGAVQLYLRKNIKYKGLTSLSAYQSKLATQALADRFGVCLDVAVLYPDM